MKLKPFSKQLLAEAESIKIFKRFFEDRPLIEGITIDGPTSKDLDDGITFAKVGDNFLLQVSIADVASVINPESKLFTTALDRVVTRYFADFNKPMLPAIISEYKLSLIPNGLKPTITFEMEILPNGDVEKFNIKETFFKNIRRLNYSDFDAIKKVLKKDPDHLLFNQMAELANLLLEKRRSNGALAIYDLIKGLYTNEEGIVLSLEKNLSHVANIVVQEFMILTNKSLAIFCAENDIPLLYRNHSVRLNTPSRSEILEQINTALMNQKFLNSLQQRSILWFNRATYDPKLTGHYGLNEIAYSHVTSPIRRVPDMINHCIIKAFLHNTKSPFDLEKLTGMSKNINETLNEIKDAKIKQFKEKAKFDSKVQLNHATLEHLDTLKASDFETLLKTAAKENILLDNFAEALKSRFESKKIDLMMVMIILFYPPKNADEWIEFRKKSLSFLYKNKGMPVQLLNILKQKGIIQQFEVEIKESELQFLAKTLIYYEGEQFSTPDYSIGISKKDATHESVHKVLKIILNFPTENIEDINNNESEKEKQETKYLQESVENSESSEVEESLKAGSRILKESESKKEKVESKKEETELKKEVAESKKEVAESKKEETKSKKVTTNTEYQPEEDSISKLKEHFEEGNQKLLDNREGQLSNSSKIFSKPAAVQLDMGDNYVGKIIELCNIHKNWKQPSYKFSISGDDHSPVIECIGTLVTKKLTIEMNAVSNSKKAAKQDVSRKILECVYEGGLTSNIQPATKKELDPKNFVGRLQEFSVKEKLPPPDYNFTHLGTQHSPLFECIISIEIKGKSVEFSGQGQTKKSSKQNAAENCLQNLLSKEES